MDCIYIGIVSDDEVTIAASGTASRSASSGTSINFYASQVGSDYTATISKSLGGADANNYDLTNSGGTVYTTNQTYTFSITTKAVTLNWQSHTNGVVDVSQKANGYSVPYDAVTHGWKASISGVISGDTVTISNATSTATVTGSGTTAITFSATNYSASAYTAVGQLCFGRCDCRQLYTYHRRKHSAHRQSIAYFQYSEESCFFDLETDTCGRGTR